MAEDTTLPAEQANVDPTDAIADLLTGGLDENQEVSEQTSSQEEESTENEEEATDDSEGAEEPTEESTEVEDSDEQDDGTEETWAGALGVDDSSIVLNDTGDFAGVNVKVDGEVSTVDLKSLIVGYQTNKHNTNTSKGLAEERKEFEGVRDNAVAEYSKKLSDIGKLSEYMHKNLMNEFNSIDWQALRQNDPAEYAAAKQDFESRDKEIKDVYSAIAAERASEADKGNIANKENFQKDLESELKKVRVNNPEWSDDKTLKKAFDDMSSFVDDTYSIPNEVFNSMYDARFVEVVKDAMAYRKGKKVAQKKINKPLPKYQKSKGKAVKSVSKLEKLTKAAKSASGSNRRDLEVDAIAELLGG